MADQSQFKNTQFDNNESDDDNATGSRFNLGSPVNWNPNFPASFGFGVGSPRLPIPATQPMYPPPIVPPDPLFLAFLAHQMNTGGGLPGIPPGQFYPMLPPRFPFPYSAAVPCGPGGGAMRAPQAAPGMMPQKSPSYESYEQQCARLNIIKGRRRNSSLSHARPTQPPVTPSSSNASVTKTGRISLAELMGVENDKGDVYDGEQSYQQRNRSPAGGSVVGGATGRSRSSTSYKQSLDNPEHTNDEYMNQPSHRSASARPCLQGTFGAGGSRVKAASSMVSTQTGHHALVPKMHFQNYCSRDVVDKLLKKGELIQGALRVNQRNYEEAYLDNPDGDQDIMVFGLRDRNRAFHGDIVVVKLKPRDQWVVLENLHQAYMESSIKHQPPHDGPLAPNEVYKSVSDIQRIDSGAPLTNHSLYSSRSDQSHASRSNDRDNSAKLDYCTDGGIMSMYDDQPQDQQRFAPAVLHKLFGSSCSLTSASKHMYSRGKMIGLWNEVDARPTINIIDDLVRARIDALALRKRMHSAVLPPERATIPRNRRDSYTLAAELASAAHSELVSRQTPSINRHQRSSPSSLTQYTTTTTNRAVPSGERPLHSSGMLSSKFVRRFKTIRDFADHHIPDACLQKTAEVVYILDKRNTRSAVGVLKPTHDGKTHWMLFSPQDSRVPRMMIPATEAPYGFFDRPQEFAKFIFIARVLDWPPTALFARGTLYKTLGVAGEIEPETEGLLCQYNIDTREFSSACMKCLPDVEGNNAQWKIPEEEYHRRRSFVSEMVFTVDSDNVYDIDDAVHVKQLDDGLWEVGVHVADVSYFINPNTELDRWAQRRATSTYLVHKTINMLPRVLCEKLCSLTPDCDRLTLSVVWKMNEQGDIVDEWFGRTVVRSCCQLSYGQAQVLIDQKEHCALPIIWDTDCKAPLCSQYPITQLSQSVHRLHSIALLLKQRRYNNGALRLDMPKLEFHLDETTKLPRACSIKETTSAQSMIEELMLLANQSAARRVYEHFPETAILRRHPQPNTKLLREVVSLCNHLGFTLDWGTSMGLQESMDRIRKSTEHNHFLPVIAQLLMKPMRQPSYFCTGALEDENEFRHYALNVPFYTHFTSPIRRYADIVVHRLLAATLGYCQPPSQSPMEMQAIAQHCNDRSLASKTVQENSTEMFFAVFIKECGPLETPAIVMNVLDHAFDVLLLKYGVVKRVYVNRLQLARDAEYMSGPPPRIVLHWEATPHARTHINNATRTQTLGLCSIVDVLITASVEPLKSIAIIKPKYDDMNSNDKPANPNSGDKVKKVVDVGAVDSNEDLLHITLHNYTDNVKD